MPESKGNMTEKSVVFFRRWKPKGAAKHANKAAGYCVHDFFTDQKSNPDSTKSFYVCTTKQRNEFFGEKSMIKSLKTAVHLVFDRDKMGYGYTTPHPFKDPISF